MATLVPSFVFTDQVPAQQLVSLAQIENANREGQRRNLQAMIQNRNQQQELQNRNAIQMAQLAQQDRQFGQEAELRKALQQADITGRKELQQNQLDFYTKNPNLLNRDASLLNAQHLTDMENWDTDADAEAARANAQLNLIEQGTNKTRTLFGLSPNIPIVGGIADALWPDMSDAEFKREYTTRAQPIISSLTKSRAEVDPITGRIRVVPIYKGRKAAATGAAPVSQADLIGPPAPPPGWRPATPAVGPAGSYSNVGSSIGSAFNYLANNPVMNSIGRNFAYGGGEPTPQAAIASPAGQQTNGLAALQAEFQSRLSSTNPMSPLEYQQRRDVITAVGR